MIQSTDNLEATNYTHQCGDILQIKFSSNLKEKSNSNDNLISTTNSESAPQKSCVNEKFENSNIDNNLKNSLNDKLNDKLTDKLFDKSADKFSHNLSSKSNSDKLNGRKEDYLIDKSTDKLIDKASNLKKNKKDDKKKPSSKKLNSFRSNLIKSNSNIPINYRKRSDIENIFDLNLIKRVKGEMYNSNRPLVFCGPSGSGKSSLLHKLRDEFPEYFGFSISHTTRKPRDGEKHGQHYYYVTREEMLKAIENDEFIEYAEFSGNIYGTSKKAVEDVRSKNKICILDIEVEGVKNVKKSNLNPIYIFIKPPTLKELENRLRRRGSETEENIQKRLVRAIDEIAFGDEEGNFDLLLVNDDFDSTYERLKVFVLGNYGLPDKNEKKCEKSETNTS